MMLLLQCGAPKIAKLVQITPITMVYGTQITIVMGVYKPTFTSLGGPTLYRLFCVAIRWLQDMIHPTCTILYVGCISHTRYVLRVGLVITHLLSGMSHQVRWCSCYERLIFGFDVQSRSVPGADFSGASHGTVSTPTPKTSVQALVIITATRPGKRLRFTMENHCFEWDNQQFLWGHFQ